MTIKKRGRPLTQRVPESPAAIAKKTQEFQQPVFNNNRPHTLQPQRFRRGRVD